MRAARAYKNKHLHQLQTVEDYRLVEEVGFHQERGRPLAMKNIYLLGIASIATVQRRIKRLRDLGIVIPLKSERDARVVQLTLSPRMQKAYAGYSRILSVSGDHRRFRAIAGPG